MAMNDTEVITGRPLRLTFFAALRSANDGHEFVIHAEIAGSAARALSNNRCFMHISLDTGHVHPSPRSEVSDQVIR